MKKNIHEYSTKGLFKLGVGSLQVEVPCKYRLQCYSDLLLRVGKSIYKKLQPHSDHINVQSVCIDLLQNIIQILDNRVMISINYELTQSNPSIRTRYKHLNPIHALQQYYIDNGDESYSNHLLKLDPDLKSHLEELAKQYYRISMRMIDRIMLDLQKLRYYFLNQDPDQKKPYILSHIKYLNSDPHNCGQQVCLLEFISGNELKKIVYKPKPCTASALILGNIAQLVEIDPKYTNCKSLLELINSKLNTENQILTYLIWPCVDIKFRADNLVNIPIDNQYGYVEYISHDEWSLTSLESILDETYRELATVPSYTSHQITSLSDKKSRDSCMESLKKAALQDKCDFIIESSEEWDQYSRACGIYSMIFILAGITDMHYGNILIHKRLPVPIDIEICLNSFVSTIQSVGCFNAENGAFRNHTTKASNLPILRDINGIYILNTKQLENNRLYHLYRREGNTLIACNVKKDGFFTGVNLALECLSRLHGEGELMSWINSPMLQHSPLRVIPLETTEFQQDLMQISAFCFNRNKITQYINSKLLSSLESFHSRGAHEQYKHAMIYATNNSSYLLKEYSACSIPCYWQFASGFVLFNGLNEAVTFPVDIDDLVPKLLKGDSAHTKETDNNYTQKSPLETLHERALFLCNTDNYDNILTIISEDPDLVSTFERDEIPLSSKDDNNYFTVVRVAELSEDMDRKVFKRK